MDEQHENGETDQGQHSGTPWYLVYVHPPSRMCKEKVVTDLDKSSGREKLQLPRRRVDVHWDVHSLCCVYTDYNRRIEGSENL